jgi:serine/threonine protein kinase
MMLSLFGSRSRSPTRGEAIEYAQWRNDSPLLLEILSKLSPDQKSRIELSNCKVKDIHLPIRDIKSLPCEISTNIGEGILKEQNTVIGRFSDLAAAITTGDFEQRHLTENDLEEQITNVRDISEGGFGSISKVKVKQNSESLVLKKFYRPSATKDNKLWGSVGSSDSNSVRYPTTRQTAFQQERDILIHISKSVADWDGGKSSERRIVDTHIVRLRAAFTSPEYFGLLLSPIAVCNLYDLLQSYRDGISDKFAGFNVKRLLWCYFGCIANAVQILHELRIGHHDVTPKNFLCGTKDGADIIDGRIRLCDFGTSIRSSKPDGQTNGEPYKNNHWQRPTNEKPSYRSDIFNVGLVYLDIYTILKGSTIESLEEFLERKARDESPTSITIHRIQCEPKDLHEWLSGLGWPNHKLISIIERLVSSFKAP